MDVTALKRRSRRILRVFAILRAVEFLFILSLVNVVRYFEKNHPSFNTAAVYLDYVAGMLKVSFAFTVAYYIFFMYIFFSLAIFILVEILVGLNSRNISFVNALPYAAHGFVLVSMASNSRDLWIIWFLWALIVIFNFYSPKILGKKLFRPPAS